MLKNNMEDVELIPQGRVRSSELDERLKPFAEENLRGQSYYH